MGLIIKENGKFAEYRFEDPAEIELLLKMGIIVPVEELGPTDQQDMIILWADNLDEERDFEQRMVELGITMSTCPTNFNDKRRFLQ